MAKKATKGFGELGERIRRNLATFAKRCAYDMQFTGEEGINTARERGNYVDHTGNLRNSIGYDLFVNGESVVKSTIGESNPVTGEKKGTGDAQTEFRNAVAKVEPSRGEGTYTLVLLAGMAYGRYVQAKGREVLQLAVDGAKRTSQELIQNEVSEFKKGLES